MWSTSRLSCLALSVVITIVPTTTYGQDRPSRTLFDRLPGDVAPAVAALGRRVERPGSEQTVYNGLFMNSSGNRSDARFIHQLPGLVRLEGFLPGNQSVSFDGNRVFGLSGRTPEMLLETFVNDTAEGMLSSVKQGAASRLIGRGFKPNARADPNTTGSGYDIYEIVSPVQGFPLPGDQLKRYYFDTKTGLLLSTRYIDHRTSPAISVETRFSNWTSQDGPSYPQRVDRYEDGQLIFSFIVLSVISGPSLDSSSFR